MMTRVKNFAEYRKEISLGSNLEVLEDYIPKHLLTKEESKNANLEKKVQTLNEYEEKRNAFQKYYYKKRVIYYLFASIIASGLIALLIYFGIRIF